MARVSMEACDDLATRTATAPWEFDPLVARHAFLSSSGRSQSPRCSVNVGYALHNAFFGAAKVGLRLSVG
jgi:hypothetical protein